MNMASRLGSHAADKVKMTLSEARREQGTGTNDPAPTDLVCGGDKFELLACSDRTAFVLRSKRDFYVAHLEGEEAARFDADYQAVRRQRPAWQTDQTLSRLWDEGGYMWFAAQDAD